MSQESGNCYEVLGVAEGASPQELKVAYRDLAKVWHPDRFAHDPRLQQKAQEKLKEINEAYEQLTSGKFRFHKQTSRNAQPHAQPNSAQQNTPRAKWQIVVPAVCVFTVVLLVSGFLFSARRVEPTSQNTAQEVDNSQAEQTFADGADSASVAVKEQEQQRGGKKPGARQLPVETMKAPTIERTAATFTPMPTVTLTIDPSTGLIATPHCPVKSRMTYADGAAPRQYCAAHKNDTSATADSPQKESRLKAVTKRIASPTKWFRGKEKSDSSTPETPASQSTAKQN